MKKILSFLTAVILFIVIVFSYNFYLDSRLSDLSDIMRNNKINEIQNCKKAVSEQLDEQTVLVLGSSELDDLPELKTTSFPTQFFNQNNYGTKVLLFGRGFTQSLFHAISAAAFSDSLKSEKLVLIISPQWFSPEGVSADAFASRFSEQLYAYALHNKKLSENTKAQLASRVESLLKSAGVNNKGVIKNNDIYVDHKINPILFADTAITNSFAQLKEKHSVYSIMKDYSFMNPAYSASGQPQTPDWQSLLQESDINAKASCTNNNFGIYNSYYDTYIAPEKDKFINSAVNHTFTVSKEYDDLKLFLNVCKELGIDPLLISVPVNGMWYDYTGFPQEERNAYYQNIRKIADEYQVKLADFSGHEYDMYFLHDIMHLGWKGWTYIDQSIYEYSQENSK